VGENHSFERFGTHLLISGLVVDWPVISVEGDVLATVRALPAKFREFGALQAQVAIRMHVFESNHAFIVVSA
jgi:hypothetical protein